MATPLPQKLGIRPGMRTAFIDAEPTLDADLLPWPDGAVRLESPAAPMDVIVLFVTASSDLEARFSALRDLLGPAGGLWIAWPKKASKRPTDLNFAIVQAIGLDAGLVDNKKCAIDTVWSGLRFVWRRTDRPPSRTRS